MSEATLTTTDQEFDPRNYERWEDLPEDKKPNFIRVLGKLSTAAHAQEHYSKIENQDGFTGAAFYVTPDAQALAFEGRTPSGQDTERVVYTTGADDGFVSKSALDYGSAPQFTFHEHDAGRLTWAKAEEAAYRMNRLKWVEDFKKSLNFENEEKQAFIHDQLSSQINRVEDKITRKTPASESLLVQAQARLIRMVEWAELLFDYENTKNISAKSLTWVEDTVLPKLKVSIIENQAAILRGSGNETLLRTEKVHVELLENVLHAIARKRTLTDVHIEQFGQVVADFEGRYRQSISN